MKPLITIEYYVKLLGPTHPNSVLEQNIFSATTFIENYCDRPFITSDSTKYLDVIVESHSPWTREEQHRLSVKAWPIHSVKCVYENDSTVGKSSYHVSKDTGVLDFDLLFSKGEETIRIKYQGGYHRGNVPDDLKETCALITEQYLKKNYKIPREITKTLDKYRRENVTIL